jgi:hypothetical protein
MARSTRITIETQSLMICHGRSSTRGWCARCAQEAEMIALESIAVRSNLVPHEVEKWLNAGDLHRSRTPSGTELICLNSLLARLGSRPTP